MTERFSALGQLLNPAHCSVRSIYPLLDDLAEKLRPRLADREGAASSIAPCGRIANCQPRFRNASRWPETAGSDFDQATALSRSDEPTATSGGGIALCAAVGRQLKRGRGRAEGSNLPS